MKWWNHPHIGGATLEYVNPMGGEVHFRTIFGERVEVDLWTDEIIEGEVLPDDDA